MEKRDVSDTAVRSIGITLLWSPAPREMFEQEIQLPEGSTVQDAIVASKLKPLFPKIDWLTLTPGIWGRVTSLSVTLRQGDRIELCRPLKVDPKVARRERFKRQGSRTTGLFAKP